ncbi:MAG: class I SAM-dependent methyltransferase [Gammaproteobacteria bacterium]
MNIEAIRQEMTLLEEVTPLEGQRYAACLQTYEAASNQRDLILSWFTEQMVPQLDTERASFLSLGCGAGELDVNILAAGKQHAAAVSYVGLEPDPRQCEAFLRRMESVSDASIDVEVHNTRFEDFNEQRRFDLVLMVHSIYYMENPAQALANARKLVSESGKLVILIASNDRLNELSSSFWAMENGGTSWFSEDLSAHLEQAGIAHERQRIEATLDITACCDEGSEQGKHIADFVAQVPTEELPTPLRGMIFSYLEASSRRDGGMRWLPHNVDAFIIEA